MVRFQTGRYYSFFGHRLACQVLPDKRIAFVDADRHICGVTNGGYEGVPLNIQAIQTFVLKDYDFGQIEYGLHNYPGLEKALMDFCNQQTGDWTQPDFPIEEKKE